MVLSRRIKFGYGVGHVLNDLCASMWFTFLLVYLQYVLQLDRGLAGFLLMLGQVADAVSTPLIGLQSDRGCALCTYGKRKSWHVIGSLCVMFSFPFIFIVCHVCYGHLGTGYILLLGIMICIFQFGWAAVQVSHLALIPDLTTVEAERDELNIIRYIFDVCSDVLVYLVAWIVFSQQTGTSSLVIDPGDDYSFEVITIVVLCVGSVFTIIFHVLIPERSSRIWVADDDHEVLVTADAPQQTASSSATRETSAEPVADEDHAILPHRLQMQWRDWLNEPQFYQVCLLYTSARLVSNLSNIYMPIYLQENLHAREEMIALVPLAMSLASVAASFLLRALRKAVGKKTSVVVGIVLGVIATVVASFAWMPIWGVFCLAVLFGTSGSLLVILSLAFAADLIDRSTDSSAFVYGIMSFGDKVVNGIAVFIIQELSRTKCTNVIQCAIYYREIMSLGIFVPLIMAFIGLLLISKQKLGRTRKLVKASIISFYSAQQDAGETSVSSISSDSSEILLTSHTSMGYGTITKA